MYGGGGGGQGARSGSITEPGGGGAGGSSLVPPGGSLAIEGFGTVGGYIPPEVAITYSAPAPVTTPASTPTPTPAPATATPTPTVQPGKLAPESLSGVSQARLRWHAGDQLWKLTNSTRKPRTGTLFRFKLSTSATVRFAFAKPRPGRAALSVGHFSFVAAKGVHGVIFRGRIAKHTKLRPGHYILTITAGAGQTKLGFTILR